MSLENACIQTTFILRLCFVALFLTYFLIIPLGIKYVILNHEIPLLFTICHKNPAIIITFGFDSSIFSVYPTNLTLGIQTSSSNIDVLKILVDNHNAIIAPKNFLLPIPQLMDLKPQKIYIYGSFFYKLFGLRMVSFSFKRKFQNFFIHGPLTVRSKVDTLFLSIPVDFPFPIDIYIPEIHVPIKSESETSYIVIKKSKFKSSHALSLEIQFLNFQNFSFQKSSYSGSILIEDQNYFWFEKTNIKLPEFAWIDQKLQGNFSFNSSFDLNIDAFIGLNNEKCAKIVVISQYSHVLVSIEFFKFDVQKTFSINPTLKISNITFNSLRKEWPDIIFPKIVPKFAVNVVPNGFFLSFKNFKNFWEHYFDFTAIIHSRALQQDIRYDFKCNLANLYCEYEKINHEHVGCSSNDSSFYVLIRGITFLPEFSEYKIFDSSNTSINLEAFKNIIFSQSFNKTMVKFDYNLPYIFDLRTKKNLIVTNQKIGVVEFTIKRGKSIQVIINKQKLFEFLSRIVILLSKPDAFIEYGVIRYQIECKNSINKIRNSSEILLGYFDSKPGFRFEYTRPPSLVRFFPKAANVSFLMSKISIKSHYNAEQQKFRVNGTFRNFKNMINDGYFQRLVKQHITNFDLWSIDVYSKEVIMCNFSLESVLPSKVTLQSPISFGIFSDNVHWANVTSFGFVPGVIQFKITVNGFVISSLPQELMLRNLKIGNNTLFEKCDASVFFKYWRSKYHASLEVHLSTDKSYRGKFFIEGGFRPRGFVNTFNVLIRVFNLTMNVTARLYVFEDGLFLSSNIEVLEPKEITMKNILKSPFQISSANDQETLFMIKDKKIMRTISFKAKNQKYPLLTYNIFPGTFNFWLTSKDVVEVNVTVDYFKISNAGIEYKTEITFNDKNLCDFNDTAFENLTSVFGNEENINITKLLLSPEAKLFKIKKTLTFSNTNVQNLENITNRINLESTLISNEVIERFCGKNCTDSDGPNFTFEDEINQRVLCACSKINASFIKTRANCSIEIYAEILFLKLSNYRNWKMQYRYKVFSKRNDNSTVLCPKTRNECVLNPYTTV